MRSLERIERDMVNAEGYQAWKEAAIEYDSAAGNDEWKADDISPYYDYALIKTRMSELKEARELCDVEKLVFNLHEGLHGNLGHIANPKLYSQAKFGTKNLITEYLNEVTDSLHYLCDNNFAELPFAKKLRFFENTGHAFGRSAMMLSGGATLGLFHVGVLRTLFDEGLLPTVVSGSSAGSIMVAVLGAHSDDELERLFDPDILYVEAFRLAGWRGLLEGKPLMDGDYLEECLQKNVGDITFEEAYQKTGRIINITVSPADPHQEARLLNTHTSPNVLVRKASLASCAVPGVFPSVMLWAKDLRGNKVPYIPKRRWVDGTIKNDLPFLRLARLYGVNHTIVSQTNPHVVPFIPRDENQREVVSVVSKFLRTNITNNIGLFLETLTNNIQHKELSLLFDKMHSLVAQPYVGDINIVPPRELTNLAKIFSNASVEEVARFVELGSHATWPKIEMIRNTTCVSRTFEACNRKLRAQEFEKIAAM